MTDRRLLQPMQKIFLDAADYIEEYGHYKGAYFGPNRSTCMVGAMITVTAPANRKRKLNEKQWVMLNAAVAYLSERRGVEDIREWNDDIDRTAAEVVQELRDAAAAYEPA